MTTYDITSPSFDINAIDVDDVLNCPYTGAEVNLTLPAGSYRIEVKGASGNFGGRNSTTSSTYTSVGGGGSATGTFTILDPTTIYINVGGCGETYTGTSTATRSGGYNGGGSANSYGGVGGGATHIALQSGLLASLEQHKTDIIIVAGGGGGSAYYGTSYYGNGGSGGGTTGAAGTRKGSASTAYCGQGGTQVSGGAAGTNTTRTGTSGSFGQGGHNTNGTSSYASAAGGGGYYGGGAGSNEEAGGGGGSGYVSTSLLTEATTEQGTSTASYANGTCTLTVLELSSSVRYNLDVTLSGGNFTSNHTNGQQSVREGSTQTFSFLPISSEDAVSAYINSIDVSTSLVTQTLTSSLSITSKVPEASYGFNLNNNYYVSQNKGVAKSAAVARVNIVAVSPSVITFNVINYAEEGYDFGVLGFLDTPLEPVYNSDNSGYWNGFASSKNTSSVQTTTYNVPIGEHYIDVKFIKDDATDSNNDTLQFQVSMEPSAGTSVTQYTLTTPEIYEDTVVEIICGDISNNFAIIANGEHATYYPEQLNVYRGSTYELQFTPIDTSDYRYVTVYDNNLDVGQNVVPPHTLSQPTYSVESVSGASYGFALTDGYYQSQNNSNNTAALCKVVFDTPVSALVTVTYQNTGNGTNNFSMISELNTDLRTDYATDTSGIYMNGSSNFHSTDTYLTYTIPAGTSYITCKHKITSSNTRGNLKFKIAIEPLESLEIPYYSYTITDVQSIHNILIFSEKIPEYLVKVECGPMGASPQAGSVYVKEGENFLVTGTPDTNYTLNKIYVNSQSVSFSNNQYTLSNIHQDANIYLLFTSGDPAFYIKTGDAQWTQAIQAYIKENGRWVEKEYSEVGDVYTKYIKRNQ